MIIMRLTEGIIGGVIEDVMMMIVFNLFIPDLWIMLQIIQLS